MGRLVCDCDSVLGTKSRDEIIEGMGYYDFEFDVGLQSITVTLPIKRREYYSVLQVLTDFDHPRPVFPLFS